MELPAPIIACRASAGVWAAVLRSNWLWPLLLLTLLPLGALVENENCVNPYFAHIILLCGINITLAVSLQLINGISGQFSLGHAGFMAIGAYLGGFATLTYSVLPADVSGDPFRSPGGVLWFGLALLVVALLAAGALWLLFILIRSSRRIHPAMPPIFMLLVILWFVIDRAIGYQLEHPAWYLLWTRGWSGLPRLLDFVIHAGMSPAARVSTWLPHSWCKPLCLLTALLIAGTFAGLSGLLVGLPTLRLRGDYLAIATLGFGEIIRVGILNTEPLGAATGLSVSIYPNAADSGAGLSAHYIFPWIFGAAVAATMVIWRLAKSAKGRAIRAVRDDEIAAAAIGIDTTHHKVIAFVIGAFFAGVAGALYAHLDGYLNTNEFAFTRSIELVVIVTIAGLGNIWWTVAVAIGLTWLPEILRDPTLFAIGKNSHKAGLFVQYCKQLGEFRMVIYSVLLIAIMLARANWPPLRAMCQRWLALVRNHPPNGAC